MDGQDPSMHRAEHKQRTQGSPPSRWLEFRARRGAQAGSCQEEAECCRACTEWERPENVCTDHRQRPDFHQVSCVVDLMLGSNQKLAHCGHTSEFSHKQECLWVTCHVHSLLPSIWRLISVLRGGHRAGTLGGQTRIHTLRCAGGEPLDTVPRALNTGQ